MDSVTQVKYHHLQAVEASYTQQIASKVQAGMNQTMILQICNVFCARRDTRIL